MGDEFSIFWILAITFAVVFSVFNRTSIDGNRKKNEKRLDRLEQDAIDMRKSLRKLESEPDSAE